MGQYRLLRSFLKSIGSTTDWRRVLQCTASFLCGRDAEAFSPGKARMSDSEAGAARSEF